MKKLILLFLLNISLSLFAQKTAFPTMRQATRDSLLDVPDGYAILNLNTGCLNYFFDKKWREVCGTCTPQMPVLDKPTILPNSLTIKVKNAATNVSYGAYTQPATQHIRNNAGEFFFTNMKNQTSYTLYVYAENDCGKSPMAIDTVAFFFEDKCKGETKVMDSYTQKIYTIQTIGNACWLTEDLFFTIEKKNFYHQSQEGKTYTDWRTANGYAKITDYKPEKPHQGLCPTGWHLPSKEEVEDLGKNLYLVQDLPFTKGNGAYSFSEKSLKVPEYLYFWTSNLSDKKEPILAMINQEKITLIPSVEEMGLAIRCVKD